MKTKLTILLIFLLLLTAAFGVLRLSGLLPFTAAQPYLPEGPLAVATVAAGDPRVRSSEGIAALVQAAEQGGCNAILLTVRTAAGDIYYESKIFARTTPKFDPLAALCAAANAKGIAVFAGVHPYAAATSASGSFSASGAFFDPTDKTYVKALHQDLSRLAKQYSVAGIVLVDEPAAGASVQALFADAKAVRTANSQTLAGFGGFDIAAPHAAELAALCASDGFNLLVPLLTQGGELYDQAVAAGAQIVLPQISDELQYESFVASHLLSGAVVGSVEEPALTLGTRASLLAAPLTATALTVPGTLAVGTPTDGETTTAQGVLIAGSSDPAAVLTIDGAEVLRTTENGSFAAWLPLALGENTFTVAQGSTSIALTVTRTAPKSSGWKPPVPSTTTDTALAGRYLRITEQLASALSDPASDSNIAQTLLQGATAQITGTVETLRGGAITTAYLLSTGDAVLSKNAELLDEGIGADAVFTAAELTAPENRLLTATLTGGHPAVYGERSGQTLTLRFLNTAFSAADLAEQFIASDAITAATSSVADNGTATLTLTFAESFNLWGYDVSYTDTGTMLRFKAAPTLSSTPGKPLAGVQILLDAGHGGTDLGALGVSGLVGGSCEKDVNLAVTTALAERLVQLGADVSMTRADDSFPTLQDRWAQAKATLPDFYLAIHHNSIDYVKDTNTVSGLECYYHGEENAAFAGALLSGAATLTGRNARPAENSYFYVCRQTGLRSALFEVGYLINPAEMESCFSARGQRLAACGIANGLLAALSAG